MTIQLTNLASCNLAFTSLPIVYGWVALKGVK